MKRLAALAAALVLSSCGFASMPRAIPVASTDTAMSWPVPRDDFTPGTTTPGCTYPRPTSERAVTAATKTKVAAEYGYTGPAGLDNVEYDHRIPFSLCGGNGADNIWPELADGVAQSTYVHNRKDQLEAFAARQVRYHHWSLAFAQNVFRGDWRVAWCKYIHSAGVVC